MKKKLFHSFLFAVTILTGSALVACGDEVQELESNVENQDETVTETTVGENCTLFSTGDDGTRTSLDTDCKFYWSEGDQIYVNTTGNTYKKTSESRLKNGDREADFVLSGVKLTAKKCSLMYIGNGMNSTDTEVPADNLKVKIEETQTQSAWGDKGHVGPSGDCGVAEAMKSETTGKYSFKLRHKAAYLIFQPYRPTGTENLDWKLMKIEIIANGATTLAGEYPFGTGELNVGGATNTANTVTLLCNGDGSTTGGFTMGTSASTANSCFVVIQPDIHELTIRYTIKIPGKENVYLLGTHGGDFGTMFFEKKISVRPYNANGVTTIKHGLSFPPLYYQWGAMAPHLDTYQTRAYDQTTNNTDLTDPFWSLVPNANEMAWYALRGDPHWDTNTVCSPDAGLTEYTSGLWLLKKNYIPGFNASTDPLGRNLVTMQDGYSPTPVSGKPDDSVISQYFFLPSLGHYGFSSLYFGGVGGFYWSRSPFGSTKVYSYSLFFYDGEMCMGTFDQRSDGFVVAPGWFK